MTFLLPQRLSVLILFLASFGCGLLAEATAAAPNRFGPRTGSRISGTTRDYGNVTSKSARRSLSNFNYRLQRAPAPHFDARSSAPKNDQQVERASYYAENPEDEVPAEEFQQESVAPYYLPEENQYYDPSCGYDSTLVECGAPVGVYSPRLDVGFQFTFVKPRFTDNPAYVELDGTAGGDEAHLANQFDYDLELTPRVWLTSSLTDDLIWRVTYWQFEHEPATATANPDADGFGEIQHPEFLDVDIATTIPTETFTAMSFLDAYTIDLEVLKGANFCTWELEYGCGVRYASLRQGYAAEVRNDSDELRGFIDFKHSLEGFGPTVSLAATRPVGHRLSFFCNARGSLLFGDGQARLLAEENSNLTPTQVAALAAREDLFSIGEAQLGLEWLGRIQPWPGVQSRYSLAMEGQVWNNTGSASSEDEDLGFFGFVAGIELLR